MESIIKILREEITTFGFEVANDLNIEIPEIELVTEGNFVALTLMPTYKDFFSISEIKPAMKIQFCIPSMATCVEGFTSDRFIRAYVRQIIAHELKHVEQSHNNPQIIIDQMNEQMYLVWSKGYGMHGAELEANRYASTWARNPYERNVFRLLKLMQELQGGLVIDEDKVREAKALQRKLLALECLDKGMFTRIKRRLFG